MTRKEKLKEANKLLKRIIATSFESDTWVYIDFVIEDRFFVEIESEIKSWSIDVSSMEVEDIVDFAYENISQWYNNSLLFMSF